ncbi:MAG: cellulose biosynthesis cyclic di-GMP-binding regulatory protein BcsB [Symploca sp. SIO1A3]|nr:cellulose biosynthesis cyclic di-GMP-binding regulatory protein BcsB [Symploca sp. SIO1A3]
MKRFFRKSKAHLPVQIRLSHLVRAFRRYYLVLLLILSCVVPIGLTTTLAMAQSNFPESPGLSPPTETLREDSTQERKEKAAGEFVLPSPPLEATAVNAPVSGQYVLEFNRSPVVGTRFSLKGIYDEARLGFTRPRDWKLKSVKALIRYRHSPALYATRSNLTVLINGASVGTIPLNLQKGEIGSQVFDVPISQIQNYNQIIVAALQNNSPTCTQDPYDPSLWTEILPDSKVTIDYEPQPIPLNFKSYPYPIFDELSLDPNQIAYLLPEKVDDTFLQPTTRFQAALGRLADYRPLDTRLVETVDDVSKTERLVVIGTPTQQPALKSLKLPITLEENKFLDEDQKALPEDVGVLLLTTTPKQTFPVLVATGNGPKGVTKAVQFLVNSKDRQLGTGRKILVKQLEELVSPPPRDWPRYLPSSGNFKLSDLTNRNNQPYKDITVRGADSPPIEIDLRALPDSEFDSGNSMTLKYSYGPQINAKTSLVEVKLNDVALVGKRLTSINGGESEKLKVDLPGDLLGPDSKIQIDFRLDARERRSCSRVTDQQLWGTLDADTSFKLNPSNTVQLPDLKLLRYGFPFGAPQDLSNTAIVLPQEPSPSELMTALEFSKRMGRLSQAESVKLAVYTQESFKSLPDEERDKLHLVGIGTRAKFPFPETFAGDDGFELGDDQSRSLGESEVRPDPDYDGVIKEIISPWNDERVLLALSSQTKKGLDQVQDLLRLDPLFFQIKEDTVLISANSSNANAYDPNAYNLEFLQRSQKLEVDRTPVSQQILRFLAGSWFMLGPAIVAATLILYGIVQLYLKRISEQV